MRRQRRGHAAGLERRLGHGQQLVPGAGADEQQVQPVADAEPVQAGGDDLPGQRRVGGPVQVEHAAAVGVGQRPDPVPGGLGGQQPGGLAAAAQDHQRDQAGLADQLGGGLPVGGADELEGAGVEPGGGHGRPDDVVEQGGGGAQGGGAGAQHAGVAGLEQLGGDVEGDVGPGLEVGPDDPDRDAALGQRQAGGEAGAGQLAQVGLLGRERRVGEQADLPGHLGDPGLVELEPVQQAAAEAGRLPGLHVGGVGGQDPRRLVAEQARHAAQGLVDDLGRGRAQARGAGGGRLAAGDDRTPGVLSVCHDAEPS